MVVLGRLIRFFFPLYPYSVGLISNISTLNTTIVGILVSSVCTLFALIFLYDLVILLYKDEALAKLSIMLLALYPTGIFLHAPFTEGMFLLCSIGCILYLERKQLIIACVFACAAGLVRPQGILLLLPISYSMVQDYRIRKQSLNLRLFTPIIIAPIGLVSYLIWRSSHGQPGLIQSFNGYSNVDFQDPVSTLFNVVISIIKQPSLIRTAEFIFVLFFLYILIWMFCRIEFRRHLGIMVYSASTWLLIVSKTTVNGIVPQLSNRYVLHIFFAFVGIGMLIQKIPTKVKTIIIFTMTALALVCSTLYSLWIFIG